MSRKLWSRHLPAGTEFEEVDLLAGGSLPAVWAQRWAEAPTRPVLHDHNGWVDGSELERRVADVAARLTGGGLTRGDRIIISAASSVDLVCAHAACLRLGAVVIPVNAAYGADELAHVVVDARPTFAIVDDDERAAHIAAADPEIVVSTPDVPLPRGQVDLAPLASTDPAMLAYTSGTTGRPKGALLSHGNLLAGVNALLVSWRWTNSDRLVLCLPLFHMHGLGVGLHGTLAAGASAILQPRFDPDTVIGAISEHSATMFFGVPTMYHRISTSPRAREMAGLRLMVSGSAPMSSTLHRTMLDITGVEVIERYGMTETVMLVSNPHDGERRGGSVGIALPGVEMRLEGDPPEVQVRGPNVFSGYWERPEANREAFVDGWFRTGDIGTFDDGYLTLDGRSKELIISGGFNVYPREVEDALAGHELIDEVAVVGTASEEWGEVVTAYVVGGPVSAEELNEYLSGDLAPYKRPRLIHHVTVLPRNALGKVQKHRLSHGVVLD